MSLVWSARISYWKERLLLVLVNNQNIKIFSNIYFSPAALWRISTFFFFFWNDGNFPAFIVALIFVVICCHQRHFLAKTKSKIISSQSISSMFVPFTTISEGSLQHGVGAQVIRMCWTWFQTPERWELWKIFWQNMVKTYLKLHKEWSPYCTFLYTSHRFVHADVDDWIPQYWALGELYWKHCHVERNILNKDC